MQKVHLQSNPTFILTLLCIALIGATISIGQYGVYVPLLVVLFLRYIYDIIRHRKGLLSTADVCMYIAYVVIFYICTLLNGDGANGRNSLLVSYAISIISFLLISKEIRSEGTITIFVWVLIGIVIINCIITIMQYYNIPMSWSVWYFFNDAKTTFTTYVVDNMHSGAQLLGKSKVFCPGIFPSSVNNGYFVASLGVLCFYPQFSKKRSVGKLIQGLLVLIILVTLLMIQQRMAFFLFLGVTCVINFERHTVVTVFTIILAAIVFELVDMQLDEGVIGRLANTEDKIRETLYETGIEYVMTHLLVGGRVGYESINEHSAHNIFLNAIMYGGLFGGIMIVVIYFRMCYKAVCVVIKKFNCRRNLSVAFAYSLIIYNLISLTHNNSLLTGDPIIWILYAMMLVAQKYEAAKSKTRVALDNRIR